MLKDLIADLAILNQKYGVRLLVAVISNRGFHALCLYRLSHLLYGMNVPFIPLVLTRIIQVLYSIDIDYRSLIEGGVIIIHGVGIVIGKGAVVRKGTIIFHGVTLGVKNLWVEEFPVIGENCILAAGCKIFGRVNIGSNSIIGANCVVIHDIPANSSVRPSPNHIVSRG